MSEAKGAEFGRLLANAISRISKLRSKTIGLIQDEIGYALGRENGGSAIAHWCKGHIPSKLNELQTLVRILVLEDGLSDDQETLALLTAANYPHADIFVAQLFLAQPLHQEIRVASTVPSPITNSVFYRKLVGRETLINRITARLSDPQSPAVIGIDGIGGIGKTAFADAVVSLCMKRSWFGQVIRLESPRAPSAVAADGVDAFTFATVLNGILEQLNMPELLTLSETQKESRLAIVLRNHRILVLLDNLETASEPQTEILRRLQPLLGVSKAIATSRQRFSGDLYPVHLQGLEGSSAQEMILEVAKSKDSSHVREASSEQLAQIVAITGGSPLAMRLVVDQLNHLPLKSVLKYLNEVKPIRSNPDQDEYIALYRYIYFPSWGLLSSAGKKLLVAMSHFVRSEGGTLEAIAHISNLLDAEIFVDELWSLSLLEVKSSLDEPAYFLHALTSHFVKSDIINIQRT